MERYLFLDEKEFYCCYFELVDYFIGCWIQSVKKGDGKGVVKDCYVFLQLLQFSINVFNYRKLKELFFYLLKLDDFDRFKQSVFCNYEFFLVKLKVILVYDVIDDFIEVLVVKLDELDLKFVYEILQFLMEVLNVFVDQLLLQFIGCFVLF